MHAAHLAGRADLLFAYATSTDKRQGGLTQGALEQVYSELVMPHISDFRITSPAKVRLEANGAFCESRRVNSRGVDRELMFTASEGDDGPVGAILMTGLLDAWLCSYFSAGDRPKTRANHDRAKLAGLRRDRKRLEELGLKGATAAAGGFFTFDMMERTWAGRLEEARMGRSPYSDKSE